MTKAERVIWELSDLYDFYLRLEQLKRTNRGDEILLTPVTDIMERFKKEVESGK